MGGLACPFEKEPGCLLPGAAEERSVQSRVISVRAMPDLRAWGPLGVRVDHDERLARGLSDGPGSGDHGGLWPGQRTAVLVR